jgi:hypothetical protein
MPLAWLQRAVGMIGLSTPAGIGALGDHGVVHKVTGRVLNANRPLATRNLLPQPTSKPNASLNSWRQASQPYRLCLKVTCYFPNVNCLTHRKRCHRHLIFPHGHKVILVQVAHLGHHCSLPTTNSRKRDILNAVGWVISHVMDMTSKDRRDVSGCHQERMHLLSPVITVSTCKPTGMMQENKLVMAIPAAIQGFPQERKLFRADSLKFWP